MQIGRHRVSGAVVVGVVVMAGVVLLWAAFGLWAALDGEGPPQAVAEVHVVADAAREPGERPSLAAVPPDGTVVRPDGEVLVPLPPGGSAPPELHTGEPVDLSDLTVAGYEGWWSGDGHGEACGAYADTHPEVVLASTRTGAVIEAHTNGARLQRPPQTPPGDPAEWPPDSVVVLDARTGAVLESFEVDETGWPIDPPPVHCVPPSETP